MPTVADFVHRLNKPFSCRFFTAELQCGQSGVQCCVVVFIKVGECRLCTFRSGLHASVQCYSWEAKGKPPKEKIPKPKLSAEERAELQLKIEANKRTHERRRLRARAKGGKGINRNCPRQTQNTGDDITEVVILSGD